MTFAARNLSVLAYANGFTLWLYKNTKQTIEEMTAPGFFAGGTDIYGAGDMVMLNGSDGGAIRVFAGGGTLSVLL